MDLIEFIDHFAQQFEDTPAELFTPSTIFKELDEWDSLTALSVMAMIDDEMAKRITGADLRSCNTVEDLFKLVISK